MSQAEGRHAPTPVLAFSLDEGSADLFINGEKRDYLLPLMFANKDLKKCQLTEPEDARDMAIVEIRKDIKPVNSEEAAGRALDEFSQNDFRHQLVNSDAAKKGLTGGCMSKSMIMWLAIGQSTSRARLGKGKLQCLSNGRNWV